MPRKMPQLTPQRETGSVQRIRTCVLAGTYRHQGSGSAMLRHTQVGDFVGDRQATGDTRTSCLAHNGLARLIPSLPPLVPPPSAWAAGCWRPRPPRIFGHDCWPVPRRLSGQQTDQESGTRVVEYELTDMKCPFVKALLLSVAVLCGACAPLFRFAGRVTTSRPLCVSIQAGRRSGEASRSSQFRMQVGQQPS